MGIRLKSTVLTTCTVLFIYEYAQATHLTVSEEPGEPLSLFIMAGVGLALVFSGVLFLLGVFLARGVKKGWGLIVSGTALIIIGAIITSEGEEGGTAANHHDHVFSLPLILLLVFFGLGVFLLLLWAYRTGQFKEMEGVKHRMLERELDFLYEEKEKNGGEPNE